MAYAEHIPAFFADFSVVASHGGDSADVILDRATPDAYSASRTARWSMTMPAGALDMEVGDTVDVDGTDYKVLDIDPADGVLTVVTLGAAA